MTHWGAPQWLLMATWATLTIGVPIAHFAVPADERTPRFFGRQAALFCRRTILLGVLLWGGFF